MGAASSLFSSPSKEAQQTASAIGAQDSNEIQSYESYVAAQEQQARDTITGMASPSTAAYAVNPKATTSFSAPAPPSGQGKPQKNYFAAPPVPSAKA